MVAYIKLDYFHTSGTEIVANWLYPFLHLQLPGYHITAPLLLIFSEDGLSMDQTLQL